MIITVFYSRNQQHLAGWKEGVPYSWYGNQRYGAKAWVVLPLLDMDERVKVRQTLSHIRSDRSYLTALGISNESLHQLKTS